MDKEILRIVIIATGLVVTLGMIFWSYFKGKQSERERDLFDDTAPIRFADTLSTQTKTQTEVGSDDFDIVHMGSAKSFDTSDNYFNADDDDEEIADPAPRVVTPSLIQFSLISNADEGFNGADLVDAFNKVGLEYGSMKIFERVDANRLVDFGVVCMVEPGTFPASDLETFYCPGVVFFMQPGVLENAQVVFDDFVDTIKLLASELDGVIWDHQRLPLTDTTVEQIRHSL
ncbi:MAG: cell division protein [Methylococcaceae bacterium]|nr:cell division protein [Methylococcaceae bacterium]